MKILVDSSYFISLFWPKDNNFPKANALATFLANKHDWYTSQDILKETLTVLSQRIGKEKTHIAYNQIGREMLVLSISEEIFDQALEVFFTTGIPKDVSVIDCASVILLKKHNLNAILTFDHHFRSLGVRVIPKR